MDGLATRTWAVVRKSPGKEPAGSRAIVVQQALWRFGAADGLWLSFVRSYDSGIAGPRLPLIGKD